MATKRQEREVLMKNQNWLSPITRRPLQGKRLETHHIVELYEGGSNDKENKQAVSIAEHLAEHYRRSKDDKRSPEERRREFDIVNSRIRELTEFERREMEDVSYLLTGMKIRITDSGIKTRTTY